MYLSSEMITKCKIDAVHIQTSTANHMLHHIFPNIHIENISYTALKGSTTKPSMRSAQAEIQVEVNVLYEAFTDEIFSNYINYFEVYIHKAYLMIR